MLTIRTGPGSAEDDVRYFSLSFSFSRAREEENTTATTTQQSIWEHERICRKEEKVRGETLN